MNVYVVITVAIVMMLRHFVTYWIIFTISNVFFSVALWVSSYKAIPTPTFLLEQETK
jgi:nicotinamide riboside transporter PnuC